MIKHKCKFCNKECKNLNSLRQHEIRCPQNPDRHVFAPKSEAWKLAMRNKKGKASNQYIKAKRLGLPKPIVSEATRRKLSESCRRATLRFFENLENRKRHSKIMQAAVAKNPQAYSESNVSGRVKSYSYNGLTFKGTWELLVAKCLDAHNIKYTNKICPIKYTWNDNDHFYFPDFYLFELDVYLEVKGYQRDRDLYKWKSLNNLIIIKENEINYLKKDSSYILEILIRR